MIGKFDRKNVENWKVDEVRTFVKNNKGKIRHPSKECDWLGLATVTADKSWKCFSLDNKDEGYKWAEIAILIYDEISKPFVGIENFIFSNFAMHLRVNLISTYGVKEGNPLLDYRIIVQWFYNHLSITLEEAISLYERLKSLSSEQKKLFIDQNQDSFVSITILKYILALISSSRHFSCVVLPADIILWLDSLPLFEG